MNDFAATVQCWECGERVSLDSVWPVACNMLIPLKLQAHYREKHPEIRAIEHIPERIERYEGGIGV